MLRTRIREYPDASSPQPELRCSLPHLGSNRELHAGDKKRARIFLDAPNKHLENQARVEFIGKVDLKPLESLVETMKSALPYAKIEQPDGGMAETPLILRPLDIYRALIGKEERDDESRSRREGSSDCLAQVLVQRSSLWEFACLSESGNATSSTEVDVVPNFG